MELPIRCLLRRFRRYFLTYACLAICCGLIMGTVLILMLDFSTTRVNPTSSLKQRTTTLETPIHVGPRIRAKQTNKTNLKLKWLNERIERMNEKMKKTEVRRGISTKTIDPPHYKFHVFYYAWYENEEYDGQWHHWNHEYLKNWRKTDKKVYPTGNHQPPHDIGSNFYPSLGCYSSRDPNTINAHMQMIRNAGIGVLIVSWYPPGLSDGRGRSSDLVFSDLLNAAERFQLKVAPHVEPYQDRNPINMLSHIKYFIDRYGKHPALFRFRRKGKQLPVYYIYDSYRTPAVSWRELLGEKGNISIRGTNYDGVFLGLLVDIQHKHEIRRAHFDGFYTYFASNGFSYGSSWKNWKNLGVFARESSLIFSPSLGPGYVDTRVRPWNSPNSRHRRRGKYYEVGWRTAMGAGADFFTITSFNEWHEGTQIEPAVPKSTRNYTYMDYEPEGPNFYIDLTNWWINSYINKTAAL